MTIIRFIRHIQNHENRILSKLIEVSYEYVREILTSGWSLTGTNTFSDSVTIWPSPDGKTNGSLLDVRWNNDTRTLLISEKVQNEGEMKLQLRMRKFLVVTIHQLVKLDRVGNEARKNEAAVASVRTNESHQCSSKSITPKKTFFHTKTSFVLQGSRFSVFFITLPLRRQRIHCIPHSPFFCVFNWSLHVNNEWSQDACKISALCLHYSIELIVCQLQSQTGNFDNGKFQRESFASECSLHPEISGLIEISIKALLTSARGTVFLDTSLWCMLHQNCVE